MSDVTITTHEGPEVTAESVGATLTVSYGAPGQTGPAGPQGEPGDPGASAYAVAVASGFSGTEAEWLDSLQGVDGDDGLDGAPGTPGEQGEPGVGVPVGGTTGQVLAKASATDHDTEWIDPSAGGGSTVTVDADGTVTVDSTTVDLATDAQLSAHEADTTSVHGIADTAALVVTTDPRLSDARTPTAHTHDDRYYTEAEVDTALAGKAATSALTSHTGNTSNPHSVTKTQVGLGNVDNTSDANKPISTATQAALDGKVQAVVAGANVTVDATDPANPIVSATGGGDTAKPSVRVSQSTPQSIPTGTDTVITWNVEDSDPHGMHSPTTNPERLTLNRSGAWLIAGLLTFGSNATGRRFAMLRHNNAEFTRTLMAPIGANPVYVSISGVVLNASVGDYVTMFCYQDSGSSLATVPDNGASVDFTYLQAVYLG